MTLEDFEKAKSLLEEQNIIEEEIRHLINITNKHIYDKDFVSVCLNLDSYSKFFVDADVMRDFIENEKQKKIDRINEIQEEFERLGC